MPFEINTAGRLVRITVQGRVASSDLAELYGAMRLVESDREVSPDRLTDLSGVSQIDLDFEKMESFASKRRTAVLRNNVRSAIVAPQQLQYGFARMFQTLNDNPKIEIAVFQDKESALRWLGDSAPKVAPDGVSRIA